MRWVTVEFEGRNSSRDLPSDDIRIRRRPLVGMTSLQWQADATQLLLDSTGNLLGHCVSAADQPRSTITKFASHVLQYRSNMLFLVKTMIKNILIVRTI